MSTTSTPATPASAADAHAAAIENHQRHKRNLAAADAELRQAALTRQALLDRASAGEAVAVSEIRAADDAAKNSEAAVALAQAVADGAQRRVSVARVAVLAAQAKDIHARYAETVEIAAQAGKDFDDAVQIARARLQALKDALAKVAAVKVAGGRHTFDVRQEVAHNPILREISEFSPGELPITRLGEAFAAPDLGEVHVGCVPAGERFVHAPSSAKGMILSAYSNALPPGRLMDLLAQ